MATFSDIRAIFGLQGTATLAGDNLSGSIQAGVSQTNIRLTAATKLITFNAVIVGAASDLVIDLSDLDNTGSTAWTAGTAQVETATAVAASGITANGNAEVIITGSGITGSPLTITVAVTTALTTATLVAGALRTAVAATSAVTALYDVGGTGENITLSRKATSTYTVAGVSVPVYPANDATLNVATQNGTSTGITTAATSANTTAGVATAGTYLVRLNGNDLEGVATGGSTEIYGVFIKNNAGDLLLLSESTVMVDYPIVVSQIWQTAASDGDPISNPGDYTLEPSGTGDSSVSVSVVIAAS